MFVIESNNTGNVVQNLTSEPVLQAGMLNFYANGNYVGDNSYCGFCYNYTFSAVPYGGQTGTGGNTESTNGMQQGRSFSGQTIFCAGIVNYKFIGGEVVGKCILNGVKGGFRSYYANGLGNFCALEAKLGLYLIGEQIRTVAETCCFFQDTASCQWSVVNLPVQNDGVIACQGDVLGVCLCFCVYTYKGGAAFCSYIFLGQHQTPTGNQSGSEVNNCVSPIYCNGVLCTLPTQISLN